MFHANVLGCLSKAQKNPRCIQGGFFDFLKALAYLAYDLYGADIVKSDIEGHGSYGFIADNILHRY